MTASRPRLAVVGSCVSRDAFNSTFAAHHRYDAELVAEVYQSSLVSLAREATIDTVSPPVGVKPNYQKTIRRELSGKNLGTLVSSKPDFIVLDFYADIHFGSTKIGDNYVTRNHMAFLTEEDADNFYNDEGAVFPERARYEHFSSGKHSYEQLVLGSLHTVLGAIRSHSPNVELIINSARFAKSYFRNGQLHTFRSVDRLAQKNIYWADIDKLARDATKAHVIHYDDDRLTASADHRWGLNPVHYTQGYYDQFWEQIKDITR